MKKKYPYDCFMVSSFSNHGWLSHAWNTTDYYLNCPLLLSKVYCRKNLKNIVYNFFQDILYDSTPHYLIILDVLHYNYLYYCLDYSVLTIVVWIIAIVVMGVNCFFIIDTVVSIKLLKHLIWYMYTYYGICSQ